jgi:RNA ligase (TIGR02306 family)
MRSLATLQRIKNLRPIEGADAIEVGTVLGWNVVVQKNVYEPNELVVFVEVDSLLPQKPQFEFLAKNGVKKSVVDGVEYEGYRLRTIKLRGQVSQGLCVPLRECPELDGLDTSDEGADVTEALGVVKYEPPIPASLAGKVKGPWPGWLPKTDETRIQSVPEVLTRYPGVKFYATEKLDGSSFTIYMDEFELYVCSHNLNLMEDENNLFWRVAKKMDLKQKLLWLNAQTGDTIAFQGELVGSGVQNNKLKLKENKVLFFNAFSRNKGAYLDYEEFMNACSVIEVETVPVIEVGFELPETVEDAVAMSTRRATLCPEVWAEGIVVRPMVEMRDPDLGRLSFKVINPNFLLKYEE